MNIFFLSLDPEEAAILHCDKHVVKMILETAQLLYSAHWELNSENLPENAYKKTHVNHPSSKWTRASLSNYKWLCSLGLSLCREYTHRYGKIHKTEAHIMWLSDHAPTELVDGGFTEPPQAMPDEYKCADCVSAYRMYYREAKIRFVTYKKRDFPDFLVNG
jgi:hypothetical protein